MSAETKSGPAALVQTATAVESYSIAGRVRPAERQEFGELEPSRTTSLSSGRDESLVPDAFVMSPCGRGLEYHQVHCDMQRMKANPTQVRDPGPSLPQKEKCLPLN